MRIGMRSAWVPDGFRRFRRVGIALLFSIASQLPAQVASSPSPSPATSPAITNLSISRPFFNPSLGQEIEIDFSLGRSGALTVDVIDPGRSRVRRILSRPKGQPGRLSLTWDGRNELGAVVPDDAYSLAIELKTRGGTSRYLADGNHLIAYISDWEYNRTSGILRYGLARPSRVRIVAFAAASPDGIRPRKSLADGEPRSAGAVIEQWNGYDATGSIYLPDLPGFTCSITAVDLPENAIITVGNRTAPSASRGFGRTGR